METANSDWQHAVLRLAYDVCRKKKYTYVHKLHVAKEK